MENSGNPGTKQILLSAFLPAFLFLVFLSYLDVSLPFKAVVFSSPLLFLAYTASLEDAGEAARPFFAMLALSLFFVGSSLVQQQPLKVTLYILGVLVCSVFLAFLLAREALSARPAKLYVLLFAGTIFLLMLLGVKPRGFFPSSSQNMFSWLGITAASLVYLIQSRERPEKYPLWPAALAFAISIWALGRSGILATGALLAGVFAYNLRRSGRKLLYLVLAGFLLASFGFAFFVYRAGDIETAVSRFRKKSVSEDPRLEIAQYYLSELDSAKSLLFGFDIVADGRLESRNYNLHNSILQLHYRMGLGGILAFLLILRGIVRRGRKDRIYYAIALPILMRIFTDTVAFVGPCDFLLYFFLFSPPEDEEEMAGKALPAGSSGGG